MKASDMTNQKFVSVLLPVFNERPVFLQKAIRSIAAQTHENLEVIIVNDGSDQRSTLECLTTAATTDSRIRVYHEPHRGVAATLNFGLERCRGDIVFRHDSSDWSEPDRIMKQVEFLGRHPEIALASCNMIMHQDNGRVLWATDYPLTSDDIRDAFPQYNPFAHPPSCFLRKPAIAIGGYREFFLGSEDYDFFWRLFERFGGENSPEVLYHYRVSVDSMSTDKCYEQALSPAMINYLAELKKTELEEDLSKARDHAERTIPPRQDPFWVFAKAERAALAGKYGLAIGLFLRGFKSAPLSLTGYLRLVRSGLIALYPPCGKLLYRRSKTLRVPIISNFTKALFKKQS
jgi:glycosyltransferase involved in cell wall biosynthesis